MKATQDLRKEHDAILYVLKLLEQMLQRDDGESMLKYYNEVLYFLKTFADKCHHGKEEIYLFKELVDRRIRNEGGPVGVMLEEHTQGREYIAQMGHSVEKKELAGFKSAALQYCELLRRHIDKENNVLFVMADKVLDEQAQDDLFEQFERYEKDVIGHGVHEKLHAMIDAWAEVFDAE